MTRDPSDYRLSIHAEQQRKHRGIARDEVAETIAKGRVKDTHKTDVALFIHPFEWYDDPVGVVANTQDGEILTVEYRYD